MNKYEEYFKEKGIPYLSEDDYHKAVFQLRGALINLMRPLEIYGQRPIVDEVIEQTVKLTEDFALKVRGIDKMLVANSRYKE